MGIFNELKTLYSCKKSGRMEEYDAYKKELELKKTDMNRFGKNITDSTQRVTDFKQKFSEDSKEYINAVKDMQRWKYELDKAKLELKFIRPNLQQDVEYRNKQYETFTDELQSVLSPNFDLRFHGTPIYFAEQIIKSGSISSTADRYDGYISSTDMKGEISVSDRENIGTTVHLFSDIQAHRRCLPSGCIFALLPKDKEDATYGPSLMRSVNLQQNPEQLFGIFTTPENIERVKAWMSEAEFNPNLVYTFEEFLQAVKEKSKEIDGKTQDIEDTQEVREENGKTLVELADIEQAYISTKDKSVERRNLFTTIKKALSKNKEKTKEEREDDRIV